MLISIVLTVIVKAKTTMLQTEGGYGTCANKLIEIAEHIISLLVRYPFLWCSKTLSEEGVSAGKLAEIFEQQSCNHLFDDRPGLYGITDLQGQQLRRSVQSSHDSSRLTVDDVEKLIEEAKQAIKTENES